MPMMEEIRGLQEVILDILLDVSKVCREHKIPFYLGEGTLLGAVRHRGFIPWDDDIDIMMKRRDFERFLKVAPEALGPAYEVQHPSTVENYWSTFIKVRLIKGHPEYRQKHIAHLTDHNGPYIDIFPLEYVPRADSLVQRMQSMGIKAFRGMLMFKLKAKPVKGMKARILDLTGHFFSIRSIHRIVDRLYKLQGRKEQPYIAAYSTYHPYRCMTVRKEVYDGVLWINFEGHKMPIPVGYDELLTTIYGDYMTLPPEEKRVIKHHFKNGDAD